jgi:NAD(P)H-hydrate epimerase
VTYSFHTRKPVHDRAEQLCGEVEVLSAGVSEEVLEQIPSDYEILTMTEIRSKFSPRPLDSNKGTFGSAMCVCGSYGMAGAVKLAAKGALRCGAGLVHVLLPESIYLPVAAELAEPVFVPLKENEKGQISPSELERMMQYLERASSVLVGCGLGVSEDTAQVVRALLTESAVPMVLDADGINLWAAHINEWKPNPERPLILTPHPGEMARLLGTTVADVQAHRQEYARAFAQKYGVVLVLKGYHTWIALPDGRTVLNLTGNPGMAKGGCGDLLAGMIVSFLAQEMPTEDAACAGVYLHGLVGDLCAQRLSQTAMLPGDMAAMLPEVFLQIEQKG